MEFAELMIEALARSSVAVRLSIPSAAIAAEVGVRDGWVRIVDAVIPSPVLDAIGVRSSAGGAALSISLDIDSKWLAHPLPQGRMESHRVLSSWVKDSPVSLSAALCGVPVNAYLAPTFPSDHDLRRAGVAINPQNWRELTTIIYGLDERLSPSHQIFGFASPVQGDVFDEVAQWLEESGDVGESDCQFDPTDYRLLFQVDWDPAIELNVADQGRLYVLAPADDLEAFRFDRTRLLVQGS